MRVYLPRPAALSLAVLLLLWPCSVFAARKHHTAPPRVSRAQAAHLARLAAQQKAAWQTHLVKLHDLPRSERRAVRRHDRLFARQQQAQHVAALAVQNKVARKAKRLARTPNLALKHLAQQPAAPTRTAKRLSPHAAKAAAQTALHNAKLLRMQKAHSAKVAQAAALHNAKIANLQAAHNAQLTHLQAAHNARLRAYQQAIAARALTHQVRLAQQQAAHNARVAAQRAHYVALHGNGSGGRSIRFWQTVAAGVPVKVITVDLNDPDVKVSAVMARRGDGTAEPFRQMIARSNPNVAVTGTFFSLDNLKPVGDIVIDGGLVHFGGMGTALCVTPQNRADMITCDWGRHHDWSPYDFVVACGPRLLRRGTVVLDPAAERFKDRHMLAPNSRIAVGVTRGNKLVFAMTHKAIYLGRLAKVMRSLGVSEAMNLDAGTSTGFYYNGATLAHPGRQLTNMIVVYGQKSRYERALDQLLPVNYRRPETPRLAHRQLTQARL